MKDPLQDLQRSIIPGFLPGNAVFVLFNEVYLVVKYIRKDTFQTLVESLLVAHVFEKT